MPKPYPDPSINQSVDLFKYANTVTNGLISPLLLAAAAIIAFSLLKARQVRNSDAAALSLMLTTILASFLWALTLITGRIIVIFVVLTLAAALWSFLDR